MIAPSYRPSGLLALVVTLLVPAAVSAQSTGLASAASVKGGGFFDGAMAPAPATFLERQLQFPRVRQAYERKAERVEAALDAAGVTDVREVFFRVFKSERELEVWVREPAGPAFTRVATYPVCELSGELGPKRKQGDLQVPEGFYSIDVFNPWSQYHLSMRVDYPNAVDRVRGHSAAPGGDIYIHGGCATVGCVPVTDEYIEEVYLMAAAARAAGQDRIPVHIFPTRLDDDGLRQLADTYGPDSVDYPFWQNLQQGYLAFERSRVLPWVDAEGGRYTFDALPSRVARSAPASTAARAATADLAADPSSAGPLGTEIDR